MNNNTCAILLCLGLYLLYVLVPLIPSVIIYRLFPNVRVSAGITVSNWKIKAGGAFAAYITVVLLGYGVVSQTLSVIIASTTCTWTVSGEVVLKDKNDHLIAADGLLKALQVELVPDSITKTNQIITARIASAGSQLPDDAAITLDIPSFGKKTIRLHESADASVVTDNYYRRIRFKDPIVIKQYDDTTYALTTSLPSGPETIR